MQSAPAREARDGQAACLTGRRALLRGAAASVAALTLPGIAPPAFAQGGSPPRLELTPLGQGTTVLTLSGGNLLAQATAEGLVLVDSGAAADRPLLQGWLDGQDTARVAAVLNTHWHPDRVGANETFGAAGARILAHEKTRQRLRAGYYLPNEDRYEPPLAPAGLPTETFYDGGSTTIGGLRFDYGYLIEAHTDGDIYVALPERNLIAAGDAVSSGNDPVLDWFGGGWLGGRLDALEKLVALGDGETRYVPAHGPVIDRAAVQAEHDVLLELFDRLVERIRLGESARDMLEAGIHEGLGRDFADPARLIRDCYEGFWAHHNALTHDIV